MISSASTSTTPPVTSAPISADGTLSPPASRPMRMSKTLSTAATTKSWDIPRYLSISAPDFAFASEENRSEETEISERKKNGAGKKKTMLRNKEEHVESKRRLCGDSRPRLCAERSEAMSANLLRRPHHRNRHRRGHLAAKIFRSCQQQFLDIDPAQRLLPA